MPFNLLELFEIRWHNIHRYNLTNYKEGKKPENINMALTLKPDRSLHKKEMNHFMYLNSSVVLALCVSLLWLVLLNAYLLLNVWKTCSLLLMTHNVLLKNCMMEKVSIKKKIHISINWLFIGICVSHLLFVGNQNMWKFRLRLGMTIAFTLNLLEKFPQINYKWTVYLTC